MSDTFTEKCFADWQQTYEIKNIVLQTKSKFQKIDIFDTEQFGRVLALDDVIQCTEKDEFIYHEMLTHVPLNAYADARSILIIGGGDGGMLEEVLKHKSVETVTMVEIDRDVVSVCRTFIPSICKQAFDDPRVTLVFADAVGFAAVTSTVTNTKFDMIIVDRSDTVGPNKDLYSVEFYRDCKQLLNPKGVFVGQCGSLILSQPFVLYQLGIMRSVWAKVGFYRFDLPTYPGGTIVLWGADWDITIGDLKQPVPDLQYYNADIHRAAFAVPTFMVEHLQTDRT
jgi:spermidine synthase